MSTCRGIAVRRRMSSKRRMPLKTSRITTKVQRSPRIAMVRPIVQLSAEYFRAGGAIVGGEVAMVTA